MQHFQNKEINAIKISLFLGGTRYLILVYTLADRLTHQKYYVYDIAAQRSAVLAKLSTQRVRRPS